MKMMSSVHSLHRMNKQLSKEETKHEDEAKLVVGRVMAGEEDTWIDDSLGHFGVSDVGKGWPPKHPTLYPVHEDVRSAVIVSRHHGFALMNRCACYLGTGAGPAFILNAFKRLYLLFTCELGLNGSSDCSLEV